jgi:type I restriction enzyme, S subunit
MSATTRKAYAFWWKDLDRWMVPAQSHDGKLQDGWNLVRIAEVAQQVTTKVKVVPDQEYKLAGVRLYGNGMFHRETVKGSESSAIYLMPLLPGAFVYNRLFAWKETFAVVPNELDGCLVSNEFPQFLVNGEHLLAQYLLLFCLCSSTVNAVLRASIGSSAVSRNRFKEEAFLDFWIPLPPLAFQQSIVDQWKQAQTEITAAFTQAEQQEKGIAEHIYTVLGIPKPVETGPPPKYMALQWKDLERWSYNFLVRSRQGLLGFHKSSYPIVPLSDCLEETTNGYCIKPVAGPTPHKMLKLNALAPSGLDLTKSKFISVPDKIAKRFSLRKGDLLICRSVGSYDHVAKCALVEEDKPDTLFPDIIIRARFKPTVLPRFVREVMLTPLGRSHFLSNARTAVGMWKIGAEDIRNFPLPLPPLDVQKEIVGQVAEKRDEIARLRESAERKARESKAEIEAMILGTKKL